MKKNDLCVIANNLTPIRFILNYIKITYFTFEYQISLEFISFLYLFQNSIHRLNSYHIFLIFFISCMKYLLERYRIQFSLIENQQL